MNQFSLSTILNIILVILGTGLLLIDLYTVCHHGKFIIKLKESKGLTIFWIVMLILWGMIFGFNISDYINYEENRVIKDILINIFWIEFSISNIMKSLRGSEIRENGIYNSGYFYKWSKIESCSWILPNTIQFRVKAFLKFNRNFEIIVKEESKLIVDEVIQRNIDL